MKNIITSISSFEKLIKADAIYVDKTDIIYSLLTKTPGMFFCSRPRRFGKTLLLSTLEAIFQGKKELFKGLKIYETDYDWKEYPVIHIDLGRIQAKNAAQLEESLKKEIARISKAYSVEYNEKSIYYDAWSELILKISERGDLVILIDEYDKLLSSNIYNPNVEEMRDVLRGFFEVIKSASDHIHLAFITGVTKFSKVSIFSSMNNLNDISMDKEYASLFGYTDDELGSFFGEYIEKGIAATGMSQDEYISVLRKKYDGYRFSPYSEIAVYNPVSIGLFFSKGGENFNNYWIDTGGTKLLMDIAKEVRFDISKDLDTPVRRASIANFDILDMASKRI